MIISRTPYRISFFGGGTDYPGWYRKHGGAVLAATINKYCYLTCRYLPPFFEHRFRVVWSKIERCQVIDEIVHPAVRETLRFLKVSRGLEIHHDGDLPGRSGIGSSSAFTVGLLHALHGLSGRVMSKLELALESIEIEQGILRETVGSQDQVSAAYGGFNRIDFLPNEEFTVRPMTLPRARLSELNSHLLLFYTGIKRTASEVAASYATVLEDKARLLDRLREFVDESCAILNSNRDIGAFGELLHRAWETKRALSQLVSNPEVDDLYREALAAGAVGGKLLGAGGGGFLLVFAPPAVHGALKKRLSELLCVPFEFEFSGSQIIFFDRREDYSGVETGRESQAIKATREWGDGQAPSGT